MNTTVSGLWMAVFIMLLGAVPSHAQPPQELFQKLHQAQGAPDDFLRRIIGDMDPHTRQALDRIEITPGEEAKSESTLYCWRSAGSSGDRLGDCSEGIVQRGRGCG